MKKQIFTLKTVFAIIAISVLLGLLIGFAVHHISKLFYPDDYSNFIEEYSEKYSVPADLIYATIKAESNFDKKAKSEAGALGLMQMLPSTYKWLAEEKLDEKYKENGLYDPETSIKYGTYYLSYLHARFGSWELASIAYNWGEGNLSKWLKENDYKDGDYEKIPVGETRKYIEKINEYREKYSELY